MKYHIEFNEKSNAIDCLERAFEYIQRVKKDPKLWKWVVISLFSSLYGFAICSIQGTNSKNVCEGKKGKLIGFKTALERCQNSERGKKKLSLTDTQSWAINKLHEEFRNNFQHFKPMLWAINIKGFPGIANDVLDVIRFLALNVSNSRGLSVSAERKVKSLVFQSKEVLKSIKY